MRIVKSSNSVILVKPQPSSAYEDLKYNTRVERKYRNDQENFYKSICFVLILAQCFALMPVNGINSKDITHIIFNWFSPKIFYSIFNAVGALLTAILYVLHIASEGHNFIDLVNILFFSSSFVGVVFFIRISYIWHDLNKKWLFMENSMRKYQFQPNIRKRFQITTGVLMFLGAGEHVLSIINNINLSQTCKYSKSENVKTYFVYAFSEAFTLFSYQLWIALFMEVFIILATFAWNFADLFIILMCSAMAERFKQLNKVVNYAPVRNEQFWKQIRNDFTGLSILCRSLDDAICHLISLSLGNNLFFICIQLFHIFDSLKGVVQSAYFICSLGFLLGRTIALCAYCCWINDESKVILNYLFEIPSEDFGTEASRFIQQISFCPIAITGSKYFALTRSLCLQVAGAIITFELILIQLSPALSKDEPEYEIYCPK